MMVFASNSTENFLLENDLPEKTVSYFSITDPHAIFQLNPVEVSLYFQEIFLDGDDDEFEEEENDEDEDENEWDEDMDFHLNLSPFPSCAQMVQTPLWSNRIFFFN